MILLVSTGVIAVTFAALGAVQTRATLDQEAPLNIGVGFRWPSDVLAADPSTTLQAIESAAGTTHSNVIRTSVSTDETGRVTVTHYMLMAQESSALFDHFKLESGRWLSRVETYGGSAVVTTSTSPEYTVVGQPRVLGNGYDLTFDPLASAFDRVPTAGNYVLEAPDAASANRFFAILSDELLALGLNPAPDFAAMDTAERNPQPGGQIESRLLSGVTGVIALTVVVLIVLRQGRTIGVLRLFGLSITRIWFKIVGRAMVLALAMGAVGCVIVIVATPGIDLAFAVELWGALVGAYAPALVASTLIGMFLVRRVRVTSLVRGVL